jgi:O-antigen/teichoic acid export membrane protein
MPQLAPILLGKEYDAGDWRYFAVALATLFFSNLNDLPFTLFRLEHKPWIFSAFTIGRIFIQVPLSIVFVAVFDWGPMGVLLANLFTAAGMQIGLLPTYIRKVDWRWHGKLMKPMLAFAIPALFTGISFYWLKLSDRYFLLHYQGKEVVGLYTVAYSLSQPLYLTLMAFRMAWPQWHYAKLHEPEKHKKMVSRSSTYFLALNALMLVMMGAFMPFIVHTFLNERFWSIGPTTFVLALSVAVYAVYFVFWVGSNVAKKNRMIPVFFLIASAANIALNFLLVPEYGMWAAAWTHVAGFAILAVTVYFYSEKWYPIPYEWGRLLKIVLAAALTLAGAWGVGWALGQDVYMPYDQLVVSTLDQVPTLLLFPLVLFATRFLTPGEREKLGRARSRLRHRGGAVRPAAAGADAASAGAAGGEAAGAGGAAPAAVDRTRQLSADDVEAEEEELEMEKEADVDFIEGPTTTTIT